MRRRFIALGLFALLFALGWWAGRGGASSGDLYSRLDTFIEILHKVEDNYVEPVQPERIIRGALHGMLRDLDPYAEFLDGESRRDRAAAGLAEKATLAGTSPADVGLALGARDNEWVVIAPRPDGPAERAGVRPGDRLLQVDGRSTAGWTLAEVVTRLGGSRGSRVRLTLLRPGEELPRELTVTRARPGRDAPPQAQLLEKGIGYVHVPSIGDSTALELRPLLRRLRADGATGLVLDLRGCVSGTARQAADVAQLFLPRGAVITTTHARGREASQRLTAADATPLLDWPLVATIDGSSARASEIVAGALQDHDRALLVGATTFGLASAQSDYRLQGGDVTVRFTTALQLTPSGRPIQSLARQTSGDDDENGDADSVAVDSAARRTYPTQAGRKVMAGGGIRPDVEVAPDSSALASAERPRASTPAPIAVANPAARLAPLSDPVVRRALAVLRRAHAPREVFAAASSVPPAGERRR